MTMEEAGAAMRAVMDREPDLGVNGFQAFYPTGKDGQEGRNSHWMETTRDKYLKDAAFFRELLAGEEALGQFITASAWLARIGRIQTINRRFGSYGLKHICERAMNRYVSNGVFIAAAIHAGFAVYRYRDEYGRTGPNCAFNMSTADIRAAEQVSFLVQRAQEEERMRMWENGEGPA
jgi:hypothetical protein